MCLFNLRATPSTQYKMAESATEVSQEIIEYILVQLISFTMLFLQIGQNLGVLFLKKVASTPKEEMVILAKMIDTTISSIEM